MLSSQLHFHVPIASSASKSQNYWVYSRSLQTIPPTSFRALFISYMASCFLSVSSGVVLENTHPKEDFYCKKTEWKSNISEKYSNRNFYWLRSENYQVLVATQYDFTENPHSSICLSYSYSSLNLGMILLPLH